MTKTPTEEAVERLKETAYRDEARAVMARSDDVRLILSELSRLQAERDRAVEALGPFAEAARTLSSRWMDHETGWQSALSRRLTVGQLKAANEALSTLPPPALSPETTEGGAA